jgi:hypothetical protein
MSASTQCPHSDVHFELNLASFGDTNIRYLEVKGRCKVCDEIARFRGPMGVSPDQATVSLFGDEASLPLMFGAEEYDGQATSLQVSVA